MIVRTAASREPATPVGITVGAGAVVMVGAGLVAAMIPAAYPDWRFGVIAMALGLFAVVSMDHVALAAVAIIGFLISNGFLEDRFGQLAWHGSADLWRMLLLIMVGAWGLAIGEAIRFVRNIRARAGAQNPAVPASAPFIESAPTIEEEKHGA